MNTNRDSSRIVMWVLGTFMVVGVLMTLGMAYGGGMGWTSNWGFWMVPMMGLMWVPIVLVIVLVYYFSGAASRGSQPVDPEQQLDARYARGEVPREQYLQIREDLRAGRSR